MKKEFCCITLALFLIGILFISVISADVTTFSNPQQTFSSGSSGNFQYSTPSFKGVYSSQDASTYWPIIESINNQNCEAGTDFIVMISPGGCMPSVVRSDLLEEQNVPVFCQLDAIKINPLIKVSSVKSISFQGDYPNEISTISFHPARAAIRSQETLLGSPIINNIGYVILVLKKQKNESSMSELVSGNLSATIYYDSEKAFGFGSSDYYLNVISDSEWEEHYMDSEFWDGKGFFRVENIENGIAKISLYTDKNKGYSTFNLKEGETSSVIYFPGFYCKAGLQLKLNDVTTSEDMAKLNIDGETIWVRDGTQFLNKQCMVNELSVLDDETGTIAISCKGNKIDLILQKKGAIISFDNSQEEFSLGDKIFSDESKFLYFGYLGSVPGDVKEYPGRNFILLIDSEKKLEKNDLVGISTKISKITEANKKIDFSAFESSVKQSVLSSTGIAYLILEGESKKINNKEVRFENMNDKLSDKVHDKLLEDYFKESENSIYKLINEYVYEKDNFKVYAEESLWNHIELAFELEKYKTAKNYLEIFINNYPNSEKLELAKDKLFKLSYFEYSSASSSAYFDNNYHYITVDSFKQNNKNKNVLVSVSGLGSKSISEGDKVGLENSIEYSEGDSYLSLEKINVDQIKLSYYSCDKKGRCIQKSSQFYKEDSSFEANGKTVVITDINVEEVAHISLIPRADNSKSIANFSFNIGIEKRAIQLSPEKTKEMIENLNESIKDWENLNTKLGNVVKGMQGACLATSTFLMLKNTFSGLSGEAMARQKVMESYRVKCDKEYKDMTHTQCYNQLSDEINHDVNEMNVAINQINDEISKISANAIINEGILGFGKVINQTKVLEEYKSKFGNEIIVLTSEGEKKININSINSLSQLREVALRDKINGKISDSVFSDVNIGLSKELLPVIKLEEESNKLGEARKQLSDVFVSQDKTKLQLIGEDNLIQETWSGRYNKDLKNPIKEFDSYKPIEMVRFGAQNYLLILGGSAGLLDVEKAYINSGDSFVELKNEGEEKAVLTQLRKYAFVQNSPCNNKYENPEVRFYETALNSQLPALVAFDVENGWYAKVSDSAGGAFSDNQKGYMSSGDVSFFYICNVGSNGLEENMKGDDICQSFDINTYSNIQSFAGCSLSQKSVQKLAVDAVKALKDVARQYGSGSGYVTIANNQIIKIGRPVGSGAGGIECQDFMSPEECLLLFNVCDPIVCPASRCDLGGKYPVANVVQSGIIGSIALCLPNYQEGIKIPICLTGIHAGLEGYISLLKSHKSCLEKNLATGEKVGICDEITSIYKCEFFWRQFAPFIKLIIPRVLQRFYGFSEGSEQGTRGGGEYMTVMHAWDSLSEGLKYFRDIYAPNMMRAFEVRSVEQAGSEACKMFVGTSFPTSADMLDNLLEPESPTQFNAWFSEIPFTDATVPATSHYKVFYHIFAGNDKGVYYKIYLRSPTESSYYLINAELSIKSGYIAKGEFATETIDTTAPAGYKELCVVIDGQSPECGFREVSTSFALDYLSNKFVEEQATKEGITSEKECISGGPSVYGLINPNLQAGVETGIDSQINLKGIIRVCASENPGKNVETGKVVDEQGNLVQRWKDVGYCDNSELRCWIDTESVKEQIKELDLISGTDTISELYEKVEKMEKEGIRSLEDSESVLSELSRKVDEAINTKLDREILEKSNKAEKLSTYIYDLVENDSKALIALAEGDNDGRGRVYSNQQIARALSLRVQLYHGVVKALKNLVIKKMQNVIIIPPEEVTTKPEEAAIKPEEKKEELSDLQKKLFGLAEDVVGETSSESCYDAVVGIYEKVGFQEEELKSVYSVGSKTVNPITQTTFCQSTPGGCALSKEEGKLDRNREPANLLPGDLIQFYCGWAGKDGNFKSENGKGLGEHAMILKEVISKEILDSGIMKLKVNGYSKPVDTFKIDERVVYIYNSNIADEEYEKIYKVGQGILTIIKEIPDAIVVSEDSDETAISIPFINYTIDDKPAIYTKDFLINDKEDTLIIYFNNSNNNGNFCDVLTIDMESENIFSVFRTSWKNAFILDRNENILLSLNHKDIKSGTFDMGCYKRNKIIKQGKLILELSKRGVSASSAKTSVAKMTINDCQKVIGEKIINETNKFKLKSTDINDAEILEQTGANNFECLVLQLAMTESSLSQCQKTESSNCLYCEGNKDETKRAYTGESYGIMQLNEKYFDDPNLVNPQKNILSGSSLLVTNWRNSKGKTENYCGKSYSGWKLALRYYQGKNPDCNDENQADYVEKVLSQKQIIQDNFPNICA